MPPPPNDTRLPAEWETQGGVMLTWPHTGGDWAPVLAQVEPVFYAIALEIARREPILINCASAPQADRVRAGLLRSGAPDRHLVTAVVPSNDTWARDHGPITILEHGTPRLLDFQFNGWGNKQPWHADNALTGRLARRGSFGPHQVDPVELVLEGGSIESDGSGTLLTTRSCLLHPQRNPEFSREALEHALRSLLGVQRILWLRHGRLEGDDTDGHIDMLARFGDTETLVYQGCDETDYRYYAELQAMHAELEQFTSISGHPYRLVRLPWPQPKFGGDRTRLPASYANFLVINDAVLLPAYDDPADGEAARLLQACFPQREVVPVPCLPLIQQFGSLHCLTMQFPKGVEFSSKSTG